MPAQIVVARDLTVVVGDQAVRLTPGEGFTLAERLIRRATARCVAEEMGASKAPKQSKRDAG